MTTTKNIPLSLQALFERLEVDVCEDDNGMVMPLTTIAGESGRYVPLYCSDSHFYSFQKDWRQGGGDYAFMTREGVQGFLDMYLQWFKGYQESLERK